MQIFCPIAKGECQGRDCEFCVPLPRIKVDGKWVNDGETECMIFQFFSLAVLYLNRTLGEE